MVNNHKSKCIICEVRPCYNGSPYCHDCESQIKADKKKPEAKPEYYLTYRGTTVALIRNERGRLSPVLYTRDIFGEDRYGHKRLKLPADKVINLDGYCPGYDRSQVKRFKACIAHFAPKFANN